MKTRTWIIFGAFLLGLLKAEALDVYFTIAPFTGVSSGGEYAVEARATDDSGVYVELTLYKNSTFVGYDGCYYTPTDREAIVWTFQRDTGPATIEYLASGWADSTWSLDVFFYAIVSGPVNQAPVGLCDTFSTSVVQGSPLTGSGWAADPNTGAPVTRVDILIDGNDVGDATLGGDRQDIATAYGRADYRYSGWSFSINTSSLSAGNHTIAFPAVDGPGATTTISGGTFSVTAPANQAPLGLCDTFSTSMVQGSPLTGSGWAADPDTGAPVTRVDILIDGNDVGDATLGGDRQDIATVYGRADYRYSGWSFSINTSSLSVGNHTIAFRAVDGPGSTTIIPGGTFSVAAPGNPNDTDGDGLLDTWEIQYFGNLSRTGLDDSDNDQILAKDEMTFGLNPTVNNLTTGKTLYGYTKNDELQTHVTPSGGSTVYAPDAEGNLKP